MPELPEVQTTVNGLNKFLPNLIIKNVRSDWPKLVRFPSFNIFKKNLVDQKIVGASRRGKNILIEISGNKTVLIHMKMTGHLMYGQWQKSKDKKSKTKWLPTDSNSPLADPYNRFIHLIFDFSNKYQLALCDSRKFAKVILYDTDDLKNLKDIKMLGPEPLDKNFKYSDFKQSLLKKPNGKIKQVLLNQEIIAGIGNIYSDEILWEAEIHPQEKVKNLSETKMQKIYYAMKKIFQKSIKLGGDSMSDYRNINGEKGGFQNHHKVYRKKGQKCLKTGCLGIIRRVKVGGRSAHFCEAHQSLIHK